MTGRSAPLFFVPASRRARLRVGLRVCLRAGFRAGALAALLLLGGAACGAPTAAMSTFAPGEPFWLALGQAAAGEDGGTVVRFAKVVGDSRCPPEAVCVWQGEVTVELGVRLGGADEGLATLRTVTEPRSATVQGRFVELLAVEGGRGAGSDLTTGYRAQLRVTFVR